MLELTTKWVTNTLAKKSIYNQDYIKCVDNKKLYIVSIGNFTTSCKLTFNYEVRDEKENLLSSGENAYLDALTKIVLGTSPKSKANKDTNESKDTSLVNEFKKLKANLAKAIEAMNSFQQKHNITTLNDVVSLEEKTIKKNEELKSLYQTLELAKAQGNNMLVDAISEMIEKKENE